MIANICRLRGRLEAFLAVTILVGIAAAASKCIDQLRLPTDTNYGFVFAGVLIAVVYRVVNAHGWFLVLRSLGATIQPMVSMRVWLTSEACRWLPGGVWGYGSRAIQIGKKGVGASTAAFSMFVEFACVATVAVAISVVGLLPHRGKLHASIGEMLPANGTGACFAIAGVLVLLAFGVWIFRATIHAKFAKLIGSVLAADTGNLDWLALGRVLMFYTLMAMMNGMITHFMLSSVAPNANVSFMVIVAATSAAWLGGFFAFAAPGGLIVREALFASIIVAWVPIEIAIASAILARLAHLVAEVAVIAVCAAEQVRQRKPSNSTGIAGEAAFLTRQHFPV